jgi:hypothetical protein
MSGQAELFPDLIDKYSSVQLLYASVNVVWHKMKWSVEILKNKTRLISASSLQQLSAGGHVAPLVHIILI